jgi:hypothetical protein
MEFILPGVMYASPFDDDEAEKLITKEKAMERRMAEGFPVKPMHDYIFVADLGMPSQSQGGVWLPDEAFTFARYKHLNERYGIVVAIGPGRMMDPRKDSLCQGCSWRCPKKTRLCPKLAGLIDEGLDLGSTVMFNRRFGSRLGMMFQPDGFAHPLYMRVLDPDKVLALVDDFKPWWDTERGVLHPDLVMSG